MIVVTHISKTGGSSFVTYLRQVFGTQLMPDYPHLPPRPRPWGRRAWGWALGEKMGVPRSTRCIVGHFLAPKYDRAFPQAKHAVWLRDPVERLVSNYHYFRSHPDPSNPICRRLVDRNLSLEKFATVHGVRDFQLKCLHGKPLSAFALVGITEHYAATMQLFARIFGCPEPAAVPRTNANPNRQGDRYPLDPGLREHIRRHNLLDEELYQAGLRRFRDLCREHGVTIPCQPLAA